MSEPDLTLDPIGRCPDCWQLWADCSCHAEAIDPEWKMTPQELALLAERFGRPHSE